MPRREYNGHTLPAQNAAASERDVRTFYQTPRTGLRMQGDRTRFARQGSIIDQQLFGLD